MRGTAWRQKFKKCGLFKDEVQAIAKAQRGQSRRLQVGLNCRWGRLPPMAATDRSAVVGPIGCFYVCLGYRRCRVTYDRALYAFISEQRPRFFSE